MEVNAEWVKTQLASIAEVSDDCETAHSREDDLHVAVLRAIAEGHLQGNDAQVCAALAITSLDMDFSRWYA
jgi:hypothetical protein